MEAKVTSIVIASWTSSIDSRLVCLSGSLDLTSMPSPVLTTRMARSVMAFQISLISD
jgi:hypothetical protein